MESFPEARDELVEALITDLEARAKEDRKWGERNAFWAQSFTWLAVMASFGSALAAAFGLPPWSVALCASIPGAMIAVEQSFNFAGRSRWHYILSAQLFALRRELKFESAKLDAVSKKYSELMLSAEERFPPMIVGTAKETKPPNGG